MSRSKENVLELYVHFIILGVVGLISAALLFKFVIISPNTDEFMGQTVSPSDVDQKIADQARRIQTKLESQPEPKGRYAAKATGFEALLQDSMPDLKLAYFAYPGEESAATESQRLYAVPEIPNPTEMAADHIRTVAFVPVVDLGIEDSYATIPTNVEDVDIVTVQAKINVTSLYESFDKTFAGRSLKAQWRDPALAKVIFAGAQLERQQLVDGVWSDWQIVPRAKIDKYRQVFSDVYQADDPSKAEILMPQFIIPELWKEALQPAVYDIAQLDMKWYPPSLLPDYQRELENAERERQRADRESAKTSDRDRRTANRDTNRGGAATMPGGDMGGMGMGMGMGMEGGMGGAGMPGMGTQREPRSRDRNTREEKTVAKTPQKRDFDKEYNDMKIQDNTDLSKLRDDLVIWAHDDTVKPGNTYRYRLRYGVFNPVAGKGWYEEQGAQYNDQIVLWSDFTDTTDKFVIDKRQYIFPTGVKANGVVVKVAKLMLGNWKTRDFFVSPGEFIGYEVEEEQQLSTTTRYNRDAGAAETTTEKVDYSTGMVFVDLTDVQDWELAGTVKERAYQSMIYTDDGAMYTIAAKDRFWPSELSDAQRMINNSAGKIVEISKDRSATGRTSPGGFGGEGMGMPGMEGMGMPGMGMPGMMGM